MYETGTEFKIILTDFHCNHKQDGLCQHPDNLDNEFGRGFKWCDEGICPLSLKKHIEGRVGIVAYKRLHGIDSESEQDSNGKVK